MDVGLVDIRCMVVLIIFKWVINLGHFWSDGIVEMSWNCFDVLVPIISFVY